MTDSTGKPTGCTKLDPEPTLLAAYGENLMTIDSLGPTQLDDRALSGKGHVAAIECDEPGTAKGAGETQQQRRSIARADACLEIEGLEHGAQFGGDRGGFP